MIHRIFDYAELPATCSWDEDGTRVSGNIVKISRAKAIVERPNDSRLEVGTAREVTLTLPEGKTFTLEGSVGGGSDEHVYLRWNHFNGEAEGSFQDFLVANSTDVSSDEERDRRWVPPRKTAERDAQRAKQEARKNADAERERAAQKKAAVARRAAEAERAAAAPKASPAVAKTKSSTPPQGVQADILARAQTIKSADLAALHDNVRVLSMGNILGLIKDAVNEVAQRSEGRWSEEQRQRLLEEAEEAFHERLEAAQAENAGLEAQIRTLEEQLNTAQVVLEDEQNRVVSANQFTVSDAGIQEMESRLGRMIDKAAKSGGVSSALEDEMRTVMARLLDDEREKIREQEQKAQTDAIDLLERKVNRLAKTLEDATKAREKAERRANALEAAGVSGPLRNVYAAGLDDEDPDKEHKLELLREIIDVNRNVREHLKKRGASLKGRSRPQGAASEEQGSSPQNQDVKEAVETALGSLGETSDPSAGEDVSTEVGVEQGIPVLADGALDETPPEPSSDDAEYTDSGVKKISVARVAPPPLDRSK